MGSTPRMSATAVDVLSALLADPTAEQSSLAICANAGRRSGTIHHILARLEGMSWVESRWEDLDGGSTDPPRRLYRLTGVGADLARRSVEAHRRTAFGLRWRPAPEQT